MKNASLVAAAGIVAVANGALLLHALRNRLGTPDAQVTLTQREVSYYGSLSDDEDSGITLQLDWADPQNLPWPEPRDPPAWLGQPLLEKLGFDCRVDPASPDAARFYQRQRPRQAYIALELDGPAWHNWLDAYQRLYDEATPRKPSHEPLEEAPFHTHLIAIDADSDPRALRARHPDRSSVIVLPALIAIAFQPYAKCRLVGHIQQIPTTIHVPRPFSDLPRRFNRAELGYHSTISYRVQVTFGSLFEPWVTAIQIQ